MIVQAMAFGFIGSLLVVAATLLIAAYQRRKMNRIRVFVLVLAVASAACMRPVITPIAPTPNVTQEAIVLPAADVGGLESVSDNVYVETCSIVAVTDTNIRSCGDVDCEDVGDILAGETVTGVCSGDWMTLGRNQFACIPALIGTGGCE